MKTITLLLILAALAMGCGKKSKFDVTPAQIANKPMRFGPGNPDFDHLPPGAKVQIIHKGDRLPNGTIATQDGKTAPID